MWRGVSRSGRQPVEEGSGFVEQVVPQSGDLPTVLSSHRTTVGGPICHSLQLEATPVCIPHQGSGISCRCADVSVGRGMGVPANEDHGEGAHQNKERGVSDPPRKLRWK